MSETGFQSYSLSAWGQMIADKPLIQNALDKVHSPNNPDWPYIRALMNPDLDDPLKIEDTALEAMKELQESELWAAYSPEDRYEAMRYANRLTQSHRPAEWTVNGRFTTDGRLFADADAERRVPAQISDLAVFTGYGAIDMFEFEVGGISPERSMEFGFRSLLHYAQFLAACSAARLKEHSAARGEAGYIKRVGHSVSKLVAVSADFEGDFYISASECFPHGANDIMGKWQKFAPARVGEVKLPAYHSTEPGILATLMRWAQGIKLPEKTQLRYFRAAIYDALSITDDFEKFSAQHYDTAFDANSAIGIDLILQDIEDDSTPRANTVGHVAIGSEMIYDSPARLRSYLRRDKNMLMRISYNAEPASDCESPQIIFEPDELPMLARVLVAQTRKGLGRTSFETMAGMIAYRFSAEFRDYVRSPEFYECNSRTGEMLARFYDF